MLAEIADNGAIFLRPAGVYPIKMYSNERLAEFAAENRMTDTEQKAVEAALDPR